MSYNLFLDDERFPRQVTWVDLPLVQWLIVRNYNDFLRIIKDKGLPQRISFDHDLCWQDQNAGIVVTGGGFSIDYSVYKERTGYDCAKWLVNYCLDKNLPLPEFYIHTFNTVGGQNIKSLLDNYNRVYNNGVVI